MREAKTVRLQDGGREIKVRVVPMDAYRGAMFGVKAACLLGVPALSALKGMKTEQIVGHLSGAALNVEGVKALLDELLECCEIGLESGGSLRISAQTAGGQVEDPGTIFILWALAFKANFGFFTNGGLKTYRSALNGALQQIA